MTFRTTAVVTALVAFVLGCAYLVAGHLVVGRWQLEATEGVLLLGRRMGALYLSLALMLFLARNAGPSPARTAITAGALSCLSALAVLGLYEFTMGRAARGILVSVCIEAVLAALFLRVLLKEKKTVFAAANPHNAA